MQGNDYIWLLGRIVEDEQRLLLLYKNYKFTNITLDGLRGEVENASESQLADLRAKIDAEISLYRTRLAKHDADLTNKMLEATRNRDPVTGEKLDSEEIPEEKK